MDYESCCDFLKRLGYVMLICIAFHFKLDNFVLKSKNNDYIPSLKYYYYFDDIGTGYKREELATNKYNEYIFVYNINSEDKNGKFTLNYLGDDSKIRLTPSVLE